MKTDTNWLACTSFKGASTVFQSQWLWRMSRFRNSQALHSCMPVWLRALLENKLKVLWIPVAPPSWPLLCRKMTERGAQPSDVVFVTQLIFLLKKLEIVFILNCFFLPLEAIAPALVRIENMVIMVAKLDYLKSRKSKL